MEWIYIRLSMCTVKLVKFISVMIIDTDDKSEENNENVINNKT